MLGPLEVVVNGEVRSLPADAERSLFEHLLLNAGRVMPATSLVDAQCVAARCPRSRPAAARISDPLPVEPTTSAVLAAAPT